jgi:ribosomal protein S18 acetylase RimI-like enzyme
MDPGGRAREPRERARVDIEVRIAQPDDEDFIAALGASCAASSVSAVRPVAESVAALSFQRLLTFCRERPGTIDLVAELDRARAGFLILLTDIPDDVTQGDQAFVAYMAVAAEARGRGVGAALIRAAEAEAIRLGLPHLSLMVTADNVEARRLYERAGLREERAVMTKALLSENGS